MIELPEGSWWDWDLLHLDGSQLRSVAGHDLTYHHWLELVFTDVAYIACPTQFQDPRFREPTADERATVRRYVGEDAPLLEVVHGLVYRCWRDDLAPGQRLAPHVRAPSS